ncbi:MAG: hypothetical protein AMXMBFR58_38570 [Phycisphaerae bacterium]
MSPRRRLERLEHDMLGLAEEGEAGCRRCGAARYAPALVYGLFTVEDRGECRCRWGTGVKRVACRAQRPSTGRSR